MHLLSRSHIPSVFIMSQWPSSGRQIKTNPRGMTYRKDTQKKSISGKKAIALHLGHLADSPYRERLTMGARVE